MTYAETTTPLDTDTDTDTPAVRRATARALFELGGALDDGRVLADCLSAEAVRARRVPTIASLVDSRRATSTKVATVAMRLLRERIKAQDAASDARRAAEEAAEKHTAQRAVRARAHGERVPRMALVSWEAETATVARLVALRVADVERAWRAAGFRAPDSWVRGAGESLDVVLTPNAHDVPNVDTTKQAVRGPSATASSAYGYGYRRPKRHPGTSVRRLVFVRSTWRLDVLHRGLTTWRDGGRPTFVLDAAPDGDAVRVSYVRAAAGFALSTHTARLRRLPDGSWVDADRPTRRRSTKGGV